MRAVALVSIPPETEIAMIYPHPDLADAYAIALPDGAARDPEVLARHLFGDRPRWIAALLRLRDLLVAGFGLKTAKSMAASAHRTPRIGIFRIYGRTVGEIVLGEDDRHLDFRVSVLCRGEAGGRELVVTTVVHCHNRLGRVYIALIAPFHRLIVRATLARASRTGWPQSDT